MELLINFYLIVYFVDYFLANKFMDQSFNRKTGIDPNFLGKQSDSAVQSYLGKAYLQYKSKTRRFI